MKKSFTLDEKENNIAILYFDIEGEKVNKFSTPVMQELEETISVLKQKSYKSLIFISNKKDFIVGADVNELVEITDYDKAYHVGRKGQLIFDDWSKLPYPTIAVIDGYCMGGGTELSLACTYRLATDHKDTAIALPEVTLGILPGWGGCQRLPKLIGIQKALDVILTGKRLDSKRALRYGMVDKIITREWKLDQAIAFAFGGAIAHS